MAYLLSRRWLAALLIILVLGPFTPAHAQSRTPSSPPTSGSMGAREIQEMLANSGLTIAQIRSRLKAQGYSEGVLDAYFSGRGGPPDSTVFGAVQALGLVEEPGSARRQRDSTDGPPSPSAEQFMDTISVLAENDTVRAEIMAYLRSRSGSAIRDQGLKVFGLDVFQRENNVFAANDAGPVPPDYRLGPGDELVLVLTGDTERAYELPVTREGMIFVPNVGGIAVANLTMRQLEELLFARLSRVYSGLGRGPGATTHFQVTVAKLGSVQVSVLGDVALPGAYRLSKLGTVLTALYASGGPTETGSLRQVEVRRGGRPFDTLDVYDYLIQGSSGNDVRLENGDVILVPPRGPRVRLAGAVTRPATYELLAGETLGDLIRMAGGFRAEADRRRVQVERFVPPAQRTAAGSDKVLFDVAGAALESSHEPLANGDVINVFPVANRVANKVDVTGNVWSPGAVALVPGMTLSQALARVGGVKPDTYFEALQISRLQPDAVRRVIRVPVPRPGAPADPAFRDEVLQPDDSVRVFSLTEYRPERYIAINGAVRTPTQVPFREGMTIRDLVMLAGGLAEGALLTEAEVARMPEDRRNGTTAITVRVPLDSTYLLDRREGTPYAGPPGVDIPRRTAPEFELKAYDHVLILRQPEWLLPRVVTVKGEVRYPGQYTLRSKSERLADVIDRAGGLTKDAYAQGIVFMRGQDSVGRIGLDLPTALRKRDHPDNLLLADGDIIEIPFRSGVVMVNGAVNSPVAVAYVAGQDLNYYVYAAGGPTARADAKRSYVTQPGGKVESRRRFLFVPYVPTPQPGSVVTVPEKPETQRRDIATTLTAATSVLASLVYLVTLVR